jgi:hypothetical protein
MSSVSDKPQGTVECLVQECPSFIQKGLLELFPGAKLKLENLCVITLSEKTENDMTSWSMAVKEEREKLLEQVSGVCMCVDTYLPYRGKFSLVQNFAELLATALE